MSKTPVFDPSQQHGTLYGSGGAETVPGARFHQSGAYFRSDGSFIQHDGLKPPKPTAAPATAPGDAPTLPAVEEGEVSALLEDPRAAELLELPRDKLIELVEAAHGPVIVGDGAHQAMVAFLVKNTKAADELL